MLIDLNDIDLRNRALKSLDDMCSHCERCINQIPSKGDRDFKACPFRSISNDYCDEYETIKKFILSR